MFKGPKDNVLIKSSWKLSYITTFSDFVVPNVATNSYLYYCHILPHEDKDMMGTFVVWNRSTDVDENDLSLILVQVQPNPVQDAVYLFGATTKTSTLRFMTMKRHPIKEMSLPSFAGVIQIDVNVFSEGMLIMDWKTEEGYAVSKVIITQ